MSTNVLLRLISLAVLLSISAFAVDGTVLINQSTIMAAGGFPYKITQPGSYKLSGNLVISTCSTCFLNGIEIDADNVTVDLNGFTITDPFGTAIIGAFGSSHPGLTVMNGNMVAQGGISNGGATIVHDVSIQTTFGYGIIIDSGKITNCTIAGTTTSAGPIAGTIGIFLGSGLVSGNTVTNYSTGIEGDSVSVTNNLILSNRIGLSGGAIGYGSNTFLFSSTDASDGTTSMKNNVCSNSTVC